MSINDLIFYIASLLAIAFAAWGLFFLWYLKSKKERDVSGGLGLQLFLISTPEGTLIEKGGDEQQIIKNFISKMEQFLSGLVSIKKEGMAGSFWKQPVFTLEIAAHNRGTEIFFYVAFPRVYDKLLESGLHGAFPDAKIEKVDDYNIFNSTGATAGGVVASVSTEILPIKTYQNLTSDPLETVSSPFSKIDEYGEGAAVQIVLRPDAKHVAERAHEAAAKVKEGKSRKEVLGEDIAMREIKKFIKPQKPEDKNKSVGHDESLAKLLEEKGGKVIFECNIRYLASSQHPDQADSLAKNLAASFQQFQNPEGNSLKPKELSGGELRSLIEKFSFRLFDEKNIIHLNVEEIASIYHFPYMKKSASTVRMLRAQEAAPPVNLPKEGVLIGESKYRGETKNILIKKDDRRRHFYSIGQTGTGKSTLMQKMIIQDIQNGEGVAVIDPHGDLIDKILGHIPKERADDVIYFYPGDVQHPMGLNMLEFDSRFPEQRSLIVNELLEIFNKLFNMSVAGGPMFEQYFRNATMLVMEDPESGNTLLEIVRVLADKAFRDYKLSKSKNIVVDTFWRQIAEKAGGESALANMVPYVVSKLDTFLANEIMRPIIAQEHSAFNVRDVMDQKKILLLNLSKGKLGDINSSLLGLIMVGKILMAALSRVDIAEGA